MKSVILSFIRLYQRHLTFFLYNSCRFQPTCSQYVYEAIEAYGIITGLSLGLKRILRCHPWNKGGPDPVPKKL